MIRPVNIDEFETPEQLADHLYVWPIGDMAFDHARDRLIAGGHLEWPSLLKVCSVLLLVTWSLVMTFLCLAMDDLVGALGFGAVTALCFVWTRYMIKPRGDAFAVEALEIVKQMERGTYRARPGELSLTVEVDGGELTACVVGGLEEVR